MVKTVFNIGGRHHGAGSVEIKWHPDSTYLATCGANKTVHIWDRHGESVENIHLAGPCTGLDWDKDGEVLAAVTSASSDITLYDLNQRKVTTVDSGLKDITFCKWSRKGPQLAVGNVKGKLLIYNKQNFRKIPVIGKHAKKISTGAWAPDNTLALGSEDKQVSLSNAEGDTQFSTLTKGEPTELKFSHITGANGKHVLACIMGRKTFYLFLPDDMENPVELAFQPKYGNLVALEWFGDGLAVLGFSAGYVVVASSESNKLGTELFSGQFFRNQLNDVSYCPALNRVAIMGDNAIKIVDANDFKDIKETIVLDDDSGYLDKCTWTADGQILTVGTKTGVVYSFLTKLPTLCAVHGTRVAVLSGLREVSISDAAGEVKPVSVEVEVEPTMVAIGPRSLGVAMNNRAWYYEFEGRQVRALGEREYLGSIDSLYLTAECAAVLAEGRVHLHTLKPAGSPDSLSKLFPEKEDEHNISCAAVVNDMLVFGTSAGGIHYFYIKDWASVNEHKHELGIRRIAPNGSGTRAIFIDASGAGYLYSPVNDSKIPIPKMPQAVSRILWDQQDPLVFVMVSESDNSAYVYSVLATSITGPTIRGVGRCQLQQGFTPVLFLNGAVVCQSPAGSLTQVVLETHAAVRPLRGVISAGLAKQRFAQALSLGRSQEAWLMALVVNDHNTWFALAQAALAAMDVDLAIRVYRQMADAGMVMALERIQSIEDRNLLSGHLAKLKGEYDLAQEKYLASPEPYYALEMRRDLMHWDQALKLAEALAPGERPSISYRYGQQLEFGGDFVRAFTVYEQGARDSAADQVLKRKCEAGMARTALRRGELSRGMQIVKAHDDRTLYRECAAILESLNQLVDAAALYQKGGNYDKAASIYIQTKNFAQAEPLLQHISAPKLHSQYAKAREAEGKYAEAEAAYTRARDLDSVVRINIDNLHNYEKAAQITRETRSVEAAKMMAKFTQSVKNVKASIEFLLMAKQSDDAFKLAQTHNQMEEYARQLGDDATTEEFAAVAQYYEGQGMHIRAGDFYRKCAMFSKALKWYLQSGADEAVDKAIELIGEAKSDILTQQLIDHLLGDSDGQRKDPKHVYKLYLALDKFKEAAEVGLEIARADQASGNYQEAHRMLVEAFMNLDKVNLKPSQDLKRTLVLIHTYTLAVMYTRLKDDLMAARALIRVCRSISKFSEEHVVNILTSAVLKCQSSGLNRSAFEYAAMLMQPQYRDKINEKYKRKVETIVRKPDRTEIEENSTPCPHCHYDLLEYELDCPSCKNFLPYCIITGKHMVTDDWCQCPNCKFPASYSAMIKFLATSENATCTMCETPLKAESVAKVADPSATLKKLQA